MNGDWFSFLLEHRLTPVLTQGYWMDDIVTTIGRYEELIGETVSIRLHGEDRQAIEDETKGEWNTLLHPRSTELARIASSITTLAERGRVVYVQVNNHYEGSAPLTIDRLQALLSRQ